MNDYWQSQTAGFTQGANNIANAMLRRPYMQARQQLLQEQAAKDRLQGGEVLARTGLVNTQNQREQFNLQQLQGLTKALLANGAMKVSPDGSTTFSPDALPTILSATAGAGKGAGDAAGGISALLKSQNAPVEAGLGRENDLAKALSVQGMKNDAAANQVKFAPNGSTAFQGTNIVGQAAATVPDGAMRTAPALGMDDPDVTVDNPKTLPTPQPKSSSVGATLARAIAGVISKSKGDGSDAKETLAKINTLTSQLGGLDGAPQAAQSKPATMQGNPLNPDEANKLAFQYLKQYGDRAKAEAAAKADGFSW